MLMGYRIPKGTALMLPPFALHTSSDNFLHPYRFWPERWHPDTASEDSKGTMAQLLITPQICYP